MKSLIHLPLRSLTLFLFLASAAWAGSGSAVDFSLQSHFECKAVGSDGYRPYYLKAIDGGTQYQDYSQTPKGLLGQNPMASPEECKRALESANHEFGVICSRTGLDGWKPTLYTGTVPGRPDFGYLGGSSIMQFDDCLKATKNSSKAGVCFWGGSDWYVSPIDKEGIQMGPFNSIDECVTHTKTSKCGS